MGATAPIRYPLGLPLATGLLGAAVSGGVEPGHHNVPSATAGLLAVRPSQAPVQAAPDHIQGAIDSSPPRKRSRAVDNLHVRELVAQILQAQCEIG